MTRDYTKIKAWQLSDQLAILVYAATNNFPKSEIWALTSLDTKTYELWAKAQEGLRTLQRLITYIEKSEV